jgi:hypothetical protein
MIGDHRYDGQLDGPTSAIPPLKICENAARLRQRHLEVQLLERLIARDLKTKSRAIFVHAPAHRGPGTNCLDPGRNHSHGSVDRYAALVAR